MWKQYLIGALISLGATWFFMRVVDLGQMGQALTSMDLIYLLPCTGLYLISYLFRAQRWHYLMRPVARVRFYPLFSALMIGFLGNNLLPAHLGEVARAYMLGKSEEVSKSAVFATVVLERVYDGLTVLFFLLLVLWFMDMPQGGSQAAGGMTVATLRAAGLIGLALFAGIMAGLQLLRWQRTRMLRLLARCLKPAPEKLRYKALHIADSFAEGLAVASPGDILWVLAYSLLTWFFLGLYAWSLFPAFGLKLGILAGLLMEVVISLALLIPAAPGFLGTFHLAAAFTLGYLGADNAVASSYAMALWLVHFVSTTLLGLALFWKQNLSWKVMSGKLG